MRRSTIKIQPCSGFYAKYFKRPLDVICALLALVAFGWLYLLIACLVRINLGTPVLFKQARPGLNEKIFELYKYRTMMDTKDENGNLLDDSRRLTPFGSFLRSTSLDEIPEVFNILRGEMSVVGPRPLLVKYLPLYTEKQHCRHLVRPGLTGLAQVSGRNAISWENKFDLDVEYVRNISLWQDVKIVIKTIWKVFKREGISDGRSSTIQEFLGNILPKET